MGRRGGDGPGLHDDFAGAEIAKVRVKKPGRTVLKASLADCMVIDVKKRNLEGKWTLNDVEGRLIMFCVRARFSGGKFKRPYSRPI